MEKLYTGPEDCDICRGFIEDIWIDGKTCWGPWANMCPDCQGEYGTQLYTEFEHVEGGLYKKIKESQPSA